MAKINFRGLDGKTLAKARKLYKQFSGEGLKPAQARRKARGLAVGKTEREAFGHADERLKVRKRGTVRVKVPKSRLDKKKEEWGVFSYFSGVTNQASDSDSEILGMTSYDITKKKIKNWDGEGGQNQLFAMHQYMERALQEYLKLELGLASIDSWNAEQDNDSRKGQKYREFAWQLTDFSTGEVRFHLRYRKGQILEADMWEGFDRVSFKIEIRELRIWE